ncbi:MAG: hypothetical protein ACJ74E_00195 [Actinomycetes bacterium]
MSELLVGRSVGLDLRGVAAYLPRLCRWRVLILAIVGSWALTGWRIGDIGTESEAVWLIRFVTAVGALGAMFALDDPSYDVTQSAVGARRYVMPIRLAVVGVATCCAGLPVLVMTADEVSAQTLWGLIIEAASLLALLTAVALTLQRRWRISEPGQFAVFGVLLLAASEQATAGRWTLLVTPGDGWADAQWRWLAIGAVALAVCLWQLRDPASRRLLH